MTGAFWKFLAAIILVILVVIAGVVITAFWELMGYWGFFWISVGAGAFMLVLFSATRAGRNRTNGVTESGEDFINGVALEEGSEVHRGYVSAWAVGFVAAIIVTILGLAAHGLGLI